MKLIYNNNKVSIYNETNDTVFYEYDLYIRYVVQLKLNNLISIDKFSHYSKKCFYIKELNTVYDNNFNILKTNVKEFNPYDDFVCIDNSIYTIDLKLCKEFDETVNRVDYFNDNIFLFIYDNYHCLYDLKNDKNLIISKTILQSNNKMLYIVIDSSGYKLYNIETNTFSESYNYINDINGIFGLFKVVLNNSVAIMDVHFNILTDFIQYDTNIKDLNDDKIVKSDIIFENNSVKLFVIINTTTIKIDDLLQESKRLQNLKTIYNEINLQQ